MKTFVLLSCALTVLALAGCAPAPLTRADGDGKVACNADYMDQVDRQARQHFAEIHWVRCPTVRTTGANG